MRRELDALGIASTIGQPGRIQFAGTKETICQTNLWLRCADRILIRVEEFPATDFDALFETTRDIGWGKYLTADAAFPVTGRSIRSTLASVPACQRTVKRAMVDALRRDHGVEQLDETGAQYKIDVAIVKDLATLTIDTTGPSLQRRGYRTTPSPGSTKETLAAALVMLSYWQRDRPLIDPCCGSGTIPIEAARIGRKIAPGRDRRFAAEDWDGFAAELWQQARADADQQMLPALEQRLLGIDISGRVLQVARENAERAGVAEDVHFQTGQLRRVTSRKRFGCLITHLPQREQRFQRQPQSAQPRSAQPRSAQHSERDHDDVFADLPEVLRNLPTWSHYFLTSHSGFERVLGRDADRRRKLYNGQHKCTYYQFHGPKPVVGDGPSENQPSENQPGEKETSENRASHKESVAENGSPDSINLKPYVHAVGPAAFGQLNEKADQQANLFATRLTKRAKHLRRWPSRRGVSCFRLYERDIPEIPLIVDRYEDYLHITEYERPHDRDPAQHANWLDLMARTAGETLQVPKQNVFFKRRGRQRGTHSTRRFLKRGS